VLDLDGERAANTRRKRIKELQSEGRKNMTTMVPANVAMYALQLQRQIEEWDE